MKKLKQITAIIAIIALLGLYGLTFYFALTDNSSTMKYLFASIIATIIFPILFWVYSFFLPYSQKIDLFFSADRPYNNTSKNH